MIFNRLSLHGQYMFSIYPVQCTNQTFFTHVHSVGHTYSHKLNGKLTSLRSSEISSSSSFFMAFSSMTIEFSVIFSWWMFSRSRFWVRYACMFSMKDDTRSCMFRSKSFITSYNQTRNCSRYGGIEMEIPRTFQHQR